MNKTLTRLAFLIIALTCPQAFADNASPLKPDTPPDYKQGRAVYKTACSKCHDSGINGAPRLSHAGDWKNRLFEWNPLMIKHADSGYLKMPAKGNQTQLSEQDVANAVFYMTEKLKAKR